MGYAAAGCFTVSADTSLCHEASKDQQILSELTLLERSVVNILSTLPLPPSHLEPQTTYKAPAC